MKTLLRSLGQLIVLFVTVFAAYKLYVVLIADNVPGGPFYRYDRYDWLLWWLSPSDVGMSAIVTIIEYIGAFVVVRSLLKRFTLLIAWGIALGIYLGIITVPVGPFSRFAAVLDRVWPTGTLATAFLVVFGIIVIPLLLAFLIQWLSTRGSSRRTQVI